MIGTTSHKPPSASTPAIERLGTEKYPAARALRQIPGVGPATSLAFVLAVENPSRIGSTHDIGAYFGLRLAQRGGRAAKRKAIVAVARKLAVLMLSLWKSGEDCAGRQSSEPNEMPGAVKEKQLASQKCCSTGSGVTHASVV